MGPKKGKDPTVDDNYWRTSIENAQLDDNWWTVKVIMIEAAGSDQDRIYLNKFEVFAAEEKRFVIKNICKTETIFMVNQLGGEKKVKDTNLRVFEEGQAYLRDKKDIPPDIQALIVKYLILKMKDEYLFIKRQRLQVREGISRESATMLGRAEVRGTVNVKPPEPSSPPPPPPPPKKGKKGETEPENIVTEPDDDKKYNTLLRVRGEEWRDKVYVDDFPTDGPNLYVAITGFVEPLLVGCLLKIGVPLNAVIQIRIDPTKTAVPSTLLRATKRGQSQTDILTEKSLKYWEDLQQLRINKDSAIELKNTAFIIFSPPYWDAESLSGNPDKIYDELCFLMYDIQDLTRQHFHYLENMDITNIPQENGEIRYQKYYNQHIDDIPLECVTAYAVLDSIIQTVCKGPTLGDENSRSSTSSALTLQQLAKDKEDKEKKTEAIVKDVFDALCMTDSTKMSYRLTYGEEFESHKDPVVIKHGDTARLSTYHLGNINMNNVVFSMLLGMPVNKLWHNKDRPKGVIEAKVNFHVNVLLSCFERKDVETAELNRLLHILACRKLFNNRSSLKKHHLGSASVSEFKKAYLKRSVLAEPLTKCPSLFSVNSTISPTFPSMTKCENASDLLSGGDTEEERIRFLFDCPDISELVSAAEIANNQALKHIIDDYEYFEDFTGTRAFQVLRDAFNKFNCVDYKYCEVTDCYVMMFYNSHDKDGIARDEWRCHLPTPVCLQDFFDFILEEHYDWIKNEEKMYDENIALDVATQSKLAVNHLDLDSCIDNQDVSTELLMEGSLKFQEKEALENSDKEVDSNNALLTNVKAHVESEIHSASSRKTKSGAGSTSKKHSTLYLASGRDSNSSVCIPSKPFQGYDLGDRRVEVFGKDGIFYSKDGTRVSSLYTLLIPLNLEYVILNVVPGNGHNEFWVHRALGDFVLPEILSTCESFRITSKDQVMINVKKQIYEVPIPITTESTTETQKSKVVLDSTSKLFNQLPIVFETKYFHSLYITWPNGLITETIYEDNSPALSHVKQYYTQSVPNLDEEMRCISLNGEVIVFKVSGDIEVLRPDGSFIKITKYGKRLKPVPQTGKEDLQNDLNSDKDKKAKGKEKNKVKEKANKVASKDTMHLEELGPQEYDLYIDEFETIDTSGLRQKWIGESSFDLNKLLIRTATDYCLGQIYSRRMDGTNILLNKDGVQIVTFPNGTRIITQFTVEEEEVYPEWTKEELEYIFDVYGDNIEGDTMKFNAPTSKKSNIGANFSAASARSFSSRKITEEEELGEWVRNDGYISVQIRYTIEHANFASVTINKADGKVTVDSPNNTSVVLDIDNHYEFFLDAVTNASFDGESLHIDYEACPECKSNTTCDIRICYDEMPSVTKVHQNWLKMKDSFCKKIVVNEEGCIHLVDDTSDYSNENITQPGSPTCPDSPEEPEHVEVVYEADERMPEAKSESSISSHGKCREMYQAKTLRFFILKRELTCSELVHRALLDQYKTVCRWQPWCSISEHDTFGDHRSLVSVLTPVHLTETEKWLMESKLADKPAFLAYKDLKKDSGKGFYHWMRPYGRFEPRPRRPANVLPPRLPRAFIMRTLEKQWKEEERNELSGARELLLAILKYRRLMEADAESLLHVAIVDPRPEDERCVDDIVQALGHRIYHDLKTRLEDDVQSRSKPDITTRPQYREPSIEGEMENVFSDVGLLEEERESLLREAEVQVMRPNLARYWHRRAEELKEEQFYLYLLREGSVPPYYRNLLGGAIWWDMNYTADEAVTIAERRKMKCVCEFPPPADDGVVPTREQDGAGDAKDVEATK